MLKNGWVYFTTSVCVFYTSSHQYESAKHNDDADICYLHNSVDILYIGSIDISVCRFLMKATGVVLF